MLCDHKPPETFLKSETENKGNDWSVKLSSYKLNSKYIKGTKMY